MNKPLPAAIPTGADASAADKPWAVTAVKVEAAVERIVATARPLRILAFGSRARGDAAPESDLDLLVVLPKGSPEAGVSSAIQDALHQTVDELRAHVEGRLRALVASAAERAAQEAGRQPDRGDPGPSL